MQSIAGAGRAFAEQSAAMSAAEQANERAKAEALLKYDMLERKRQDDLESTGAANKLESYKYQSEQYMEEAKLLDDDIAAIAREIAEMEDSATLPGEASKDPAYIALKERQKTAIEARNAALRNSQYYRYMYGSSMGTYGTPVFWDPNNPDALAK
jgi:hypothetical protein